MSLLASALALSAGPSGSPTTSDPPPVRVVSSTDTRLELVVRLLDDSAAGKPPVFRELRLERTSADRPWRMARGLADGEVAGPDRLVTLPPDGTNPPFRTVSSAIAEAHGDGVTLVDLPEDDAAICLWADGTVRTAWFLDGFFPEFLAAMERDGTARPENVLWRAKAAPRPDPHIRACVTLCLSGSAHFREAAGIQLAAAAPAAGATAPNPERPLPHAHEASDAAFAFGQVGVDPPAGAARDLYRWVMEEAEAAFTVARRRHQGEPKPSGQAASVGAPSRDANDSTSDTVPGDNGLP